LNTVEGPTGNVCFTGTNQLYFLSGTYHLFAHVPGSTLLHKARLYNVTDGTYVYGTSGNSTNVTSDSVINIIFTCSGSKTFEIQHRSTALTLVNGLGLPSGLGPEIYTTLWVNKIG
jgi:hypothetical protein